MPKYLLHYFVIHNGMTSTFLKTDFELTFLCLLSFRNCKLIKSYTTTLTINMYQPSTSMNSSWIPIFALLLMNEMANTLPNCVFFTKVRRFFSLPYILTKGIIEIPFYSSKTSGSNKLINYFVTCYLLSLISLQMRQFKKIYFWTKFAKRKKNYFTVVGQNEFEFFEM